MGAFCCTCSKCCVVKGSCRRSSARKVELLLAGGASLEPKQVSVGRSVGGKSLILLLYYRTIADGGIYPYFNLGMAVGEGKHAAFAVIARREIGPGAGLAHVHAEEAVVDGVGVLINDHPGQRRGGVYDGHVFCEKLVSDGTLVDHFRLSAEAAHHAVH